MKEYRITDSKVAALRRAANVYSAARRLLGLPRELCQETHKAMVRRRIALNR